MGQARAARRRRSGPASPSLDKEPAVIRTPDHRVRVFVSSTLLDLTAERDAAREAIAHLRLSPVMFELSARPHPPRELYHAYLEQSHVFVGIYWQSYGWIAPGMEVSGLEDEYLLARNRPRLLYVKEPAPEIETRLLELLERIRSDNEASYKIFRTAEELRELLENDLAVLLTERFEMATPRGLVTRAASRPPAVDNLPVQWGPLIGRAAEISAAEHLLRSADVGLLTLTGPGGCGKTRLAVHVAGKLAQRFEDGVCFVPLASVVDAEEVPSTIARALDLRETGDRPADDVLRAHLRDKHLLLILDNFEQVLDAGSYIARLLEECPRLTVLVTSRAALRLRDEHEMPVPPLPVPHSSADGSVASVSRYGAVELFVQRARDVQPDFKLTSENSAAVAEICRRLDGLPLAIELAAARIKLLAPRAMLARLERCLPLLTGGARDLPARQQTLRDTIGWSYDLLSEGERRLFRRLSVFPGGSTLEAAGAICCEVADLDLLDALEGLIDKSLLRQSEDPDGEPRFLMLQTFMEYGLEKLAEENEVELVRGSLTEYYRSLVAAAEPELTGVRGAAWLNRLESEHDNLRAVLHRAVEQGEAGVALEIVGSLWRFWLIHSHFREGSRWLEAVLGLPECAASTTARARALVGLGHLARGQGEFARARRVLEESCALCREIGDRATLSLALHALSTIPLLQENYDEAEAIITESLALAREVGDPETVAGSLNSLGLIAMHRGDQARVHEIYDEVLGIYRTLGHERGVALALSNLGLAALVHEDFIAAGPLLGESLTLFAGLKDDDNIVADLMGLAGVAVAAGQPERAARLCGAAEALREAIGAPISSLDRGPYERTVEALGASLNAEIFASEWAIGRAMPLEAAIGEALAGIDAPQSDAPAGRSIGPA